MKKQTKKKVEYKIYSSRHDVPRECIGRFESSSEESAKKRFRKDFVEKKRYSWDDLELVREFSHSKTIAKKLIRS